MVFYELIKDRTERYVGFLTCRTPVRIEPGVSVAYTFLVLLLLSHLPPGVPTAMFVIFSLVHDLTLRKNLAPDH
jgi:hypothetical protein